MKFVLIGQLGIEAGFIIIFLFSEQCSDSPVSDFQLILDNKQFLFYCKYS